MTVCAAISFCMISPLQFVQVSNSSALRFSSSSSDSLLLIISDGYAFIIGRLVLPSSPKPLELYISDGLLVAAVFAVRLPSSKLISWLAYLPIRDMTCAVCGLSSG